MGLAPESVRSQAFHRSFTVTALIVTANRKYFRSNGGLASWIGIRGRTMLFRVHSAAVFGIKAYPVAVEVDLSSGEKLKLMTVGLPDTAVRESSERVKAALRNCGCFLPAQRITINLDRKSTRLNSSHSQISYAVFCLKKKK